jgi:uncharacterized membrane protein
VLVPGVVTMSNAFLSTLKEHEGLSLIAPRSNPKTAEFAIPAPLPFNFLGLSAIVIWVKSLPLDIPVELRLGAALRH